jgi:hypothetical protein
MTNERLYRRTQAGVVALERQDAGVPLDCRRVLGLVEGDMHPDTLRARSPRLTATATARILDDLVARGLLEALAVQAHHDLDFTVTLSLAQLRKAPAGVR